MRDWFIRQFVNYRWDLTLLRTIINSKFNYYLTNERSNEVIILHTNLMNIVTNRMIFLHNVLAFDETWQFYEPSLTRNSGSTWWIREGTKPNSVKHLESVKNLDHGLVIEKNCIIDLNEYGVEWNDFFWNQHRLETQVLSDE